MEIKIIFASALLILSTSDQTQAVWLVKVKWRKCRTCVTQTKSRAHRREIHTYSVR